MFNVFSGSVELNIMECNEQDVESLARRKVKEMPEYKEGTMVFGCDKHKGADGKTVLFMQYGTQC